MLFGEFFFIFFSSFSRKKDIDRSVCLSIDSKILDLASEKKSFIFLVHFVLFRFVYIRTKKKTWIVRYIVVCAIFERTQFDQLIQKNKIFSRFSKSILVMVVIKTSVALIIRVSFVLQKKKNFFSFFNSIQMHHKKGFFFKKHHHLSSVVNACLFLLILPE